MIKFRLIIFSILLTGFFANSYHSCFSQDINWLSFEEAVRVKKPKKTFIDIYTHWCGWCKRMDATTFKDSAIVNYLNTNYNAVKLNAETKDTIYYNEKRFIYTKDYKANELAISLLNGKMGYPSFVVLDEQFNLLTVFPGYIEPKELLMLLKYFAEEVYKTMPWEDYKAKQ